jgi:hypothetical protein
VRRQIYVRVLEDVDVRINPVNRPFTCDLNELPRTRIFQDSEPEYPFPKKR